MSTIVITILFTFVSVFAFGQSILGKWQFVQQSNCEGEIISSKDIYKKLVPVVTFKDKRNGEETVRMLTNRKPSGSKVFLYKIDETTLYILDKKTQMIIDRFVMDFIQPDSLTLSNLSEPCNSKIFVRIK